MTTKDPKILQLLQSGIMTITISALLFAGNFAFSSNAKLEVALEKLMRIEQSMQDNSVSIRECRAMIQVNASDILVIKEKLRRGNL